MKKRDVILFLIILLALAGLLFGYANRASAYSTYFTDLCTGCHGSGSVSTCNGCHSHGTHSDNSKSSLNITATTDKTTYQPGEAISVTISGGYRSGWARAVLYDQNMIELDRSTGTVISGAIAPSGAAAFPVTLSGQAPATPGTYTFNASWYGNKYDATGAFFGSNWKPDSGNANHGEEIVATNSFTVSSSTPSPAAAISVTDSVSPATDLQIPFGTISVDSSATQTVTVSNTGTANLTLGTVGSADPLAAPFSVKSDTCSSQSIAPAASCTISIGFAPTEAGTFSDSFSIPSNDSARQTVTIQVGGSSISVAVNNPPGKPVLTYPADQQQGLDTSIVMKWQPVSDPDGDTVTYQVVASTNQSFSSTIVARINPAASVKALLLAGPGLGFIFLGFAFIRNTGIRKGLFVITAVSVLAGGMLAACSSSKGDVTAATEVTRQLSGLQSGTTYYWKVTASDGKGGTTESDVSSFSTK